MDERQIKRDTEEVVRKIVKEVEKYDTIDKDEFSAINRKVMEYASKNTGVPMDQVLQKMSTVIQAIPLEYGKLDESAKSWDAMIAYLYMKYLKELGAL